jgi:hypothetical protein
MEIKIFSVHSLAADDELEEVNRFLRSHRILQVDKTFSSEGGYWSIP